MIKEVCHVIDLKLALLEAQWMSTARKTTDEKLEIAFCIQSSVPTSRSRTRRNRNSFGCENLYLKVFPQDSPVSSHAEGLYKMAGLINFEDENEVKEFLDNLGVEYSYQCYKEKDPEGCQRLSDYLEGVKKNYSQAAQVLKHNCENYSHSESCYKLGAYHVTGKGGVTECLKSGYACFVKACNAKGKKSVDACHNVGLLAHDGRALEGGPDPVAARQYYKKACKGGFAPSCFNLSALYIQGSAEVNQNMSKALKYAVRSCDLGHVWGCANASRMYKLGDGTKKDEQKAEELKNRAKELHGQQKEQQLKFGE